MGSRPRPGQTARATGVTVAEFVTQAPELVSSPTGPRATTRHTRSARRRGSAGLTLTGKPGSEQFSRLPVRCRDPRRVHAQRGRDPPPPCPSRPATVRRSTPRSAARSPSSGAASGMCVWMPSSLGHLRVAAGHRVRRVRRTVVGRASRRRRRTSPRSARRPAPRPGSHPLRWSRSSATVSESSAIRRIWCVFVSFSTPTPLCST